jgi:hypothetical protein
VLRRLSAGRRSHTAAQIACCQGRVRRAQPATTSAPPFLIVPISPGDLQPGCACLASTVNHSASLNIPAGRRLRSWASRRSIASGFFWRSGRRVRECAGCGHGGRVASVGKLFHLEIHFAGKPRKDGAGLLYLHRRCGQTRYCHAVRLSYQQLRFPGFDSSAPALSESQTRTY